MTATAGCHAANRGQGLHLSPARTTLVLGPEAKRQGANHDRSFEKTLSGGDRGVGWLVYLLHHSLIADAHRPEFGPVGFPGYLGFIEADGSLRAGHDVFNDF